MHPALNKFTLFGIIFFFYYSPKSYVSSTELHVII